MTQPLPSWRNGVRTALIDFVARVTTDGEEFVPPQERIAVFDNDGTLWCEQPLYIQFAFAFDRIKSMATAHPQWKYTEPYQAVLEGDLKRLGSGGEKSLLAIMTVTHAGMTTDEFDRIAREWVRKARHPHYHRPYTRCVYQPMLELLAYLREHEFKTFIVSGGGVEFIRTFAEETYGIPPEQVVGSSGVVKFEWRGNRPVMVKEAKIEFIDDGAGKPAGIHRFIGHRPLIAFGNSDGDLQMLQYTTAGDGARFGLVLHHNDAEREFAYDRDTHFGKLDRVLDEAPARGWTVVSMKDDWTTVFPPA